jgi:hypothetical protein
MQADECELDANSGEAGRRTELVIEVSGDFGLIRLVED